MKKKIILYILITIEIIILLNSNLIKENIINTTKMFIYSIMPSMYPTQLLGLLLVKENVILIVPNFIKNIFKKIYKIDDNILCVFIMSFICGSPCNAIFINEYLEKELIDEESSKNLLLVTHFINPLFVISISKLILNKTYPGIIIIFLILLSNMIKMYILKEKIKPKYKEININNTNTLTNITSSIKTVILTQVNILSTIIAFNIIIELISMINDSFIIKLIIEMTTGLINLKNVNISNLLKFIIMYATFTFQGICMHIQTLSIYNKKIRYFKYLIFRC